MKKFLTIATTLLISTHSFADGRSAAQNLFSNLSRARQEIGENASSTLAAPTLVRGMYALSDSRGKFVGFTNEAGTLFGDSRGFIGLSAGGSKFVPLTPDQTADLRREVAANIYRDKLITVRYGAEKTRLYMFSAIDCPHCKKLEDQLRKAGDNENTTFYVIPSSLQSTSDGAAGRQQWQRVSSIWCAADAAHAWKTYWATGATPTARACSFSDAKIAEHAQERLWGILKGVGVAVHGTPAYIREDGLLLNKKTLGLPLEGAKPAYWLTGADGHSTDDFRPQRVGR